MKMFIFAISVIGFFTVGAEAAYAHECNYLLKDSYGQTLKVIKGRDYYSQARACLDAKDDCERMARQNYSYGSYCIPQHASGYGNGGYGNGGYGHGNSNQCVVELVDRRGYVVESFYSRSGHRGGYVNGGYGHPRNGHPRNNNPSVCRDALRDCNKFKVDYNFYGARCQTRR